MPKLAIPQKNLIHAVDAILVALDPVSHLVKSDTVMLFAKDDMDEAGISLEEKDVEEAVDAQSYIVETLGELRGQLSTVIPQYQYQLEIVYAMYEIFQEGVLIREAQRKLREKASVKTADLADLVKEQGVLKARAEAYGALIKEITGLDIFGSSAAHIAEAEDRLKGGDSGEAAKAMAQAEKALLDDTGVFLDLMKRLHLLLIDPTWAGYVPSEEVVLARKVLGMAGQQKLAYRESNGAEANKISSYEAKLREFEKACGPFIESAKEHKNPVPKGRSKVEAVKPIPPANLHLKLVDAREHLRKAAVSAKVSDRAKSLASQKKAVESLRYFIVEYAMKFAVVPGPLGEDESVSDVYVEKDDIMQLFVPGVLTGERPPDGKLEWEVLGKRDRAALNENFARELPLEYRAILKDYYERLAK